MYVKAKKSKSIHTIENSRAVSRESEKDQQETAILTPSANSEDEDSVEKKPKDGSLSEKFFLSNPPED
ncbi:MAG: hypothetical protein JRC90_03420 [Deltaproteobacteria bacterium]|nr:hypothetical protein [Deltaproteobacteria bacterium]